MIVATDVQYDDENRTARAAAVAFAHWFDSEPFREWTVDIEGIEPYVPGEFYKRELPCLSKLFGAAPFDFNYTSFIVVDGHVWLEENHPGLGWYVWDSLADAGFPVIGVAKTRFHTRYAREILRGGSDSPLYVTSQGINVEDACIAVQTMHGPHRIPTMLKRVDALARGR